MGLFRRRSETADVRRIVLQMRRRQGWLRRLPPPEIEKIVETIETDLVEHPTRDALLEHLARLHFDARARREAQGSQAEKHPDTPRRLVETVIFERRYGEKLVDALGLPDEDVDQREQANVYVEGVLRRLGVLYTALDRSRWLVEADGCSIYLQHYAAERVLDVYAPIMAIEDADDHEALFEELLASNGGSIAGAFYGICTFNESGRHLCACGRIATAHMTGPEVLYVLNSVSALVERFD